MITKRLTRSWHCYSWSRFFVEHFVYRKAKAAETLTIAQATLWQRRLGRRALSWLQDGLIPAPVASDSSSSI